ncbi:hypothetical protein ACHAPT_001533 [Fusarium lateritium]
MSKWFDDATLRWAGVDPSAQNLDDSSPPEFKIRFMKRYRNYIDRKIVDTVAMDTETDYTVLFHLSMEERDVLGVTVPSMDLVGEDTPQKDEELEGRDLEMVIRQRLRYRKLLLDRMKSIVATHGPIPRYVAQHHVNPDTGDFPRVSLVHHLPNIISKGYPVFNSPMPGEGNSPVKVNWARYQEASRLWQQWGYQLDAASRKVWLANGTKLNTTPNTKTPGSHRLGRAQTLTWAGLTLLKVIFGVDRALATKVAIKYQNEFLQADLASWEPNTDGPTTSSVFRLNVHRKHLDNSAMELE